MLAAVAAGVAVPKASAYWSPVPSTEVTGWYTKAGEYTGHYITNAQFVEMTRRVGAGAQSSVSNTGSGWTGAELTKGGAIWEGLRTTATTAGTVETVRQMKGEGLGVMQAVKSWPLLKTLGTVGLAATAFDVGWKVGSFVADILMPGEDSTRPSEAGFVKASGLVHVDAGETITNTGSETACPSTPCVLPVVAPAPGLAVQLRTHTGTLLGLIEVMAGEKQCGSGGGTVPVPKLMPVNTGQLPGGTARCGISPDPERRQVYGVYFSPVRVPHLPGETFTTPETVKEGSKPTPKSASEATAEANKCMTSKTECSHLQTWWPNNDPDVTIHSEAGAKAELFPYDPLTVTVPDCDGLTYSECESALEEADLVPDVDLRTWETAVITKPAGAVISITPGSTVRVAAGSKVEVDANPDAAEMPLVVPEIDVAGETYAEYITKLNPSFKPESVTNTDATTDLDYGPDEVTRTNPQPQTRFDPATEPGLKVYVNPPDAPVPATGWSPPTVPALDFSPFELVTPCDVFPFGVACWVVEAATEITGPGDCPVVEYHFIEDRDLDLCLSEPMVNAVRPWLLLVGGIFIVMTFAAWSRSGGVPADRGGEDVRRDED